MTKIVYNDCYGGFSLSPRAIARYWEIKSEPMPENWYNRSISRHDPILAQVVEELGEAANGSDAYLCIRELPSGTRYRIDEYDGMESVMTPYDYEWVITP